MKQTRKQTHKHKHNQKHKHKQIELRGGSHFYKTKHKLCQKEKDPLWDALYNMFNYLTLPKNDTIRNVLKRSWTRVQPANSTNEVDKVLLFLKTYFEYSVYYEVLVNNKEFKPILTFQTGPHFIQETLLQNSFFPHFIIVHAADGVVPDESHYRLPKPGPPTLPTDYVLCAYISKDHYQLVKIKQEETMLYWVAPVKEWVKKGPAAVFLIYAMVNRDVGRIDRMERFLEDSSKLRNEFEISVKGVADRDNSVTVEVYRFFSAVMMTREFRDRSNAYYEKKRRGPLMLGYLNDEVINSYLKLMCRNETVSTWTSNTPVEDDFYKTARFVLRTIFHIRKSKDFNACIDESTRQLKNLPATSITHCILPYNLGDSHWVLLHLFKDSENKACVDYYDSFNEKSEFTNLKTNKFVQNSLRCLDYIWSGSHVPPEKREYNQILYRHPQEDGVNCGVFTCFAARMLASNPDSKRFVETETSESFLMQFRWHIWFSFMPYFE